ncbi:MAG: type II toxin-antitoxin system prevent-host-death family antitoxin [Eubacteriales bacterium]|nr:type II toxin-antitoxin system prevent-host-death family antitoxin [Eubacteriales bacterium]
MPQCIPIRDLKNTAEISQLCQRSREPITITKNGYDDMVIMSAKVYDKMRLYSVYERLMEAEDDIAQGRIADAHASLQGLRAKYGL